MAKPATFDGYSDQYTVDCERVLVTLLRGLGPWKDSVYLVGGLTPRYLVAARPPAVPAHAGTMDVDIVIDLQILADTQAYRTLEENLNLIYCIEHAAGGIEITAEAFRIELQSKHGAVIAESLAILRSRFAQNANTEGYRKDGPVAVAKFELGESDDADQREARALRQREVSDLMDQLLARLDQGAGQAT